MNEDRIGYVPCMGGAECRVEDRTCREETMVRSGHRGEDNFKIYLGIFRIALLHVEVIKLKVLVLDFKLSL